MALLKINNSYFTYSLPIPRYVRDRYPSQKLIISAVKRDRLSHILISLNTCKSSGAERFGAINSMFRLY